MNQPKPPRSSITSLRVHHLRLKAYIVYALLSFYHTVTPPRLIEFKGIKLFIPRGVFDPSIAISSGAIIDVLSELSRALPRGKALDYCCGCGVIGIYMAKVLGYKEVHLFDEDPLALASSTLNSRLNSVSKRVKVLTKEPPYNQYDVIVVNPPYLPLAPRRPKDFLWCGGDKLEIYKLILIKCLSMLKRGGLLVASFSSLSLGAKEFLEKMCRKFMIVTSKHTPFDTVFVALCSK